MFVTLPRDVVAAAIDRASTVDGVATATLVGTERPEESVIQVWRLRDSGRAGAPIDGDEPTDHRSAFTPPAATLAATGSVVVGDGRDAPEPSADVDAEGPTVRIAPAPEGSERSRETVDVDGTTWRVDIDETDGPSSGGNDSVAVVHGERDARKRIDGLIDTDALADAHVTIVGLGTVGSTVAVELAKSGVGNFTLIDPDRLEIHNVVRHECGVDDLGRSKPRAVADRIRETNPLASIATAAVDVTERPGELAEHVADTDLVAVCTDTEASKLVVNRECLAADVPAVYGGVYAGATGGDVIRVVPGETPCYDCVLGDMADDMARDERVSGEADYGRDPDDQPGPEPGLSVDVGFVSLIQTRYALAMLSAGAGDGDRALDRDVCFWGNEAGYIFDRPLQSRFATVSHREDCYTCGGTGTLSVDDHQGDEPVLDSVTAVDEDPRPDRRD
ncbi:ThiF family protein, putative [Halorubrum californiense DSM 19288]|uniref:ThiF family protein, putative n=1 Tax=Halorubrum californiense DSM 19288 TaxID=1227465 RepID=M0DY00_9EURY|nr:MULTISPECIES: ThiF family adenylyltransferase [Halorubrum]ELZ39673.1 ThiF family protein, putative [Halorubrum californiense DSM 19288]TKX67744.1 ThiF family adenylyltransferase [Halorubrum sp. GN11GM_10-3_MGM]